jgi:hypothetical protein
MLLRISFLGTVSTAKLKFENDFQKGCRKGAKFAACTAFWAIIGDVSCLFSLALEFSTRFRGGSFQPLTHLSGKQLSVISQTRFLAALGMTGAWVRIWVTD